ncbi:MAG TPA: hypothetical protein VH764_03645, partial [Gemmatimonadales bacterium]
SLGPEIVGRLRRGEPAGGLSARRRAPMVAALAALVAGAAAAAAVALAVRESPAVTVDRCCYDLDGGGDADDGVLVNAQRNAAVHRLRIYEDLDRSGAFSEGDLVRLERGGSPTMHRAASRGLVTIEHCCLDFDGGGPADDGLVVIGIPPDRVVMAAIYERPDGSDEAAATAGFPLR